MVLSALVSTSVLAQAPGPGGPPPGGVPPAFAQPAGPAPPAPPPLPDGTPDISGLWFAGVGDYVNPARDEIPLTPEYARKLREWVAAAQAGRPYADSVTRCEAFGMPRVMTFGLNEILQTPGRVTVITEVLHEVRRIWTDGRKHPDDLDLTYGGHSVGRWEGTTLVIDTVGVKAGTLDQYGVPFSDEIHITERMRRVDGLTLENQITLVDPKAFTKPWTVTKTYRLAPPGFAIEEYICSSNNRNAPDAQGRATAR